MIGRCALTKRCSGTWPGGFVVFPPVEGHTGVDWFLGTVLTTTLMVLVMSYVAMPLMTRLFRSWLASGP